VVMSSRPGRVVVDLKIEAPHPRDLSFRETAQFAGYVREVRQIFEAEGVL
jgi:ABC-type nitrate/sulfonate/bicarbonate transport system ATPase subunit